MWPRKKPKKRDFEGRCGKCGKRLDIVVAVISQHLLVLRLDKVCEKHPEDSMLLFPRRDDIVRVEWDNG